MIKYNHLLFPCWPNKWSLWKVLSERTPKPGTYILMHCNKTCFTIKTVADIHIQHISHVTLVCLFNSTHSLSTPLQKQCKNKREGSQWNPNTSGHKRLIFNIIVSCGNGNASQLNTFDQIAESTLTSGGNRAIDYYQLCLFATANLCCFCLTA